VGLSVEVGKPKRITDRVYVRSKVIQPYNCEFQYKRNLKVERQDK
jgi:hypothetical protein